MIRPVTITALVLTAVLSYGLYELKDEDVTAEKVLQLADDLEKSIYDTACTAQGSLEIRHSPAVQALQRLRSEDELRRLVPSAVGGFLRKIEKNDAVFVHEACDDLYSRGIEASPDCTRR